MNATSKKCLTLNSTNYWWIHIQLSSSLLILRINRNMMVIWKEDNHPSLKYMILQKAFCGWCTKIESNISYSTYRIKKVISNAIYCIKENCNSYTKPWTIFKIINTFRKWIANLIKGKKSHSNQLLSNWQYYTVSHRSRVSSFIHEDLCGCRLALQPSRS